MSAALLRCIDNFQNLSMVVIPVVLNAPRLRLQRRFVRISDWLQGVDRLQNLPELISSDRIWVQVAGALQHIAIVPIAFLICLNNDISGSQD